MNKNISQFEVEDFVLEDTFRSWVLESDSPHWSFWNQYLSQHPNQKSKVLEAKNLVLILDSLEQETPDQEMADAMWKKIQAEILAEPQPENNKYSSCLA